uniref:NOT2/NOT3/NOT5 C-terminal domain-containing protein n=1 Tax=Panagrolaimus sp. JU765 TaxID=591449 RepID=A0AC34QV88_9BILA
MSAWNKPLMKPVPQPIPKYSFQPNAKPFTPSHLLPAEYGMRGIVNVLKSAGNSDGLAALSIGYELSNLGLNLKISGHELYKDYGGPFSDRISRTQDIECQVPEEYRTNAHLRKRLPPIKLTDMSEDLLFYIFYNCTEEAYQTMVAHELYVRDWRFHKIKRVWLMKFVPKLLDPSTDLGKENYYMFDTSQWKKIKVEMPVEFHELEPRPPAPKCTTIPVIPPPSPKKDS